MKTYRAELQAVAAEARQLPPPGLPEVAVVGRSNCGKSSLLNRLTGVRRLARVSGRPGRTRQIIFFNVEERLLLVDLPGYGYARAPRAERESWQGLVNAYLGGRRPIGLVLALFDIRREPDERDAELLALLRRYQLDWRAVWTKADKLTARRARRRAGELDRLLDTAVPGVISSARTGQGRPELLELIEQVAGSGRGG